MKRRVFLIGLPGAGKTTMGLELANELDIQFVDLDQEVEKAEKQSISNIFEEKGEAHFRQLEKLHLHKVIDELPQFVMATGGGTPCFFDNMNIMKAAGETIYIQTPIEIIKSRIQKDTTRPLMKSNRLEQLFESRKGWYELADKNVSTLSELLSLFGI